MLRFIIALPFLLILVLFALSNREPTAFHLWPTDYAVTAPLSLAVVGAMGVAFVVGALLLWLSVVAARHRARRAEHKVRLLEAQVAELKAKLATATLPAGASGSPARALIPVGR
jgi:uncharacterized integral membrane protein